MASKITTDMIKPFAGAGDVVAWIKKVELVARLQKVSDVASFLPLFLEDAALALFLQMSDDDQKDIEKIKSKLVGAFSDSAHVAYAKMVQKKWSGENIDVYANEISRLAGLAGFEGESLERLVKLNFVSGLPDSVSVELQQVQGLLDQSIGDIIERARILTSNIGKCNVIASVKLSGSGYSNDESSSGSNSRSGGFKGKCFRCEGPHMARVCPEKNKQIICYKCRKVGHISTVCTEKVQGNE